MRKKAAWLIAVCLGLGLISFAVLGLDSGTVSAELSQQTQGTFVRLDDNGKKLVVSMGGSETAFPASSTVWVYRNMQKSDMSQLKAGDSLDIILNSKDQAAYVKAISPEVKASPAPAAAEGTAAETAAEPQTPAEGAAAPLAGPSLPPVVSAEAEAPASSSAGSVAAAGKSVAPAEPGNAPKASDSGWEKLSFEWKSRDLVLEVKQEAADPSKGSELYLKRNDRSVVHLNGEAAAAMIQLFLKGLPADHAAFEKALKQKIAAEFQLKDVSPEWKLDVKWKEASSPASAKPAVYPPDPQGKAQGLDKEREKAEPKDKAKGKSGKEEEKEKGKDHSHKNDRDED
ncbi:hypothetical protein ACHHV8_31760 [Paenibacillus sp. TAB 01]|uniref:hypothetical protein n=1 Tax=Paenibacillus sp. TAB 01 TaxID=3368988 RepID=UPI003750E2DB